jgi:hypothetical protein
MHCGQHAFDVGLGAGFRRFSFFSVYNERMNGGQPPVITDVTLLYNEFTIPVFFGYQLRLFDHLKMNFDLTLGYGRGLMRHRFVGSPNPLTLSWHNSYRADFRFLTQYKKFSFGPCVTFDYFTRGQRNGVYTVGMQDYLIFSAFGAMLGYAF